MPLFLTDTGCRWRKTLVSITTTRLRRSRGAGWRKMLFHTCELRMKSPTDMEKSLEDRRQNQRAEASSREIALFCLLASDSCLLSSLYLDERFRIIPLLELVLKLL